MSLCTLVTNSVLIGILGESQDEDMRILGHIATHPIRFSMLVPMSPDDTEQLAEGLDLNDRTVVPPVPVTGSSEHIRCSTNCNYVRSTYQ